MKNLGGNAENLKQNLNGSISGILLRISLKFYDRFKTYLLEGI